MMPNEMDAHIRNGLRDAGRLDRLPDERKRDHYLPGDGWHIPPKNICQRCKDFDNLQRILAEI